MTKGITQRYIYKIRSSRIKQNKSKLDLSIKEAKENEELISIADSTTLRFIRDITGDKFSEDEVKDIKRQIREIKKEETSTINKNKIKKLYEKLDKLIFVKDYVCVVMENKKDYDVMNKGFEINGIKFKRLLATTGGVKNSIIIYVNSDIYDELNRRLDNGRDMNKRLVPAKLEAYKALACSASIPITYSPMTEDYTCRILVVPDCVTNFKANVIELNDEITNPPKLNHIDNYDIEMETSDGFGLISPKLSEQWSKELTDEDYISSGFCIRNSFCKGMLFTFDFHKFADSVAKNKWVIDSWGDARNIDDIDIILTESMLKLHSSYSSIEDYLDNCQQNGYQFSITKIIPKELENERNLNYQFLQPLHLSDKDIDKLIKPTVTEIRDILGGDYKKAILFSRGTKLTNNSVLSGDADYIQALMIDRRMINDPFVRNRIHKMMEKRITDAKVGVLKLAGNFSIISGDPYLLAQSIFGLKNITGLLKAGEFYSAYWNERDVKKVVAFRAPMTCHNNIRVLRLKDDEEVREWYKYMNRCTILNGWDTTTHALNGADFDSDSLLTTNNPIVLKGVKELDAIICKQSTVGKIIPTEVSLIQSNKNGFGDDIGKITNKITSMFTVQSQFNKNSEEYKVLEGRIIWGQHFQQAAIDKIKGIKAQPMPNEWTSYYSNIIKEDDSEEVKKQKKFNFRILAEKKPYFMTYIYPREMKKYKTYVNKAKKNSIMRFGITLDELIDKDDKSKDEVNFIDHYYLKMPVNIYPSLMNKICYKVEKDVTNIKNEFRKNIDFNYTILKCEGVEVSQYNIDKIRELYRQYKKKTQSYCADRSQGETDKSYDGLTKSELRKVFVNEFKAKADAICNNEYELCNIVLDLCYTNNESKQFAWDVSGETIIKNLLRKNNYTITYPELDGNGSIEFGGCRFSMKEIKINKEELDEVDTARRESCTGNFGE